MNWLKEQNRKTREFIRGDFGDVLWMCAVAFGVLILAGFVLGMLNEGLTTGMIQRFSAQIEDMDIVRDDGSIRALGLLKNNLTATFFTVAYGFIPFLFLPVIALGVNSLILGVFAANYVRNGISLLLYVSALIPHGIFEIPAIVIAIALGMHLCRQITYYVRKNPKDFMVPLLKNILRVMLLRVAPLLVVASVIEAYVTPWIVSLF